MSVKVTGIDKVQAELKRLGKATKELEKTNFVSFEELFNPSFMSKHTSFQDFEEFLLNGGFNVNSREDFEAIPDEAMDSHVSKTTDFQSWEAMSDSAMEEFVTRKLGF